MQGRRPWFDPWVGKIPCSREWLPIPVFLPGEFHGQRSLVNYNPQGHKELDTTEELTLAYTGSNSAHRNTIHTRTTEPCSTSPRLTDSVTPSCLHTPGGERCSEVGTGRHLWPSLRPGTQQVLKERGDTKLRCRKEEQRGISGQSSLLLFVVWNFGAWGG